MTGGSNQKAEAPNQQHELNRGERGLVIWITGLSASGKTTIGELIVATLRRYRRDVVFLDGDQLRQVLGDLPGYSASQRRQCAAFYSRLCKMLSEQGLLVVISTISMFEDCRQWNRKKIKNYFEVYLRVPIEVLRQRSSRYPTAETSEGHEIVGVDIPFDEPQAADVVIDNDSSETPGYIADQIIDQLKIHGWL